MCGLLWVNACSHLRYRYIDGVFTDDVQGLGEEHPNAAPNMGLTNEQVVVLQEATQVAYNQMLAALRDVNGYNWQVGR